MQGRRSTDQASNQRPDPVPLTSGPGGPTGPGGPCQTEVWREQLQEQPVLSVVYSANTLLKVLEPWKSLLASQLLAPVLGLEQVHLLACTMPWGCTGMEGRRTTSTHAMPTEVGRQALAAGGEHTVCDVAWHCPHSTQGMDGWMDGCLLLGRCLSCSLQANVRQCKQVVTQHKLKRFQVQDGNSERLLALTEPDHMRMLCS